MWWGRVIVALSGFRIIFALSVLICIALRIRINLLKAVKLSMPFSQSSYKLNRSIYGSVAFRILSPNFSIFRQAWKGNYNSLPLITIFGKSKRCTSKGSSIPFLVTIICLGCSSTGKQRIRAATSSAVFHLASCPRRFWPAQTLVWIILRKSYPVLGLKMKIAPLIGLVVRFPSWVLWIVTR